MIFDNRVYHSSPMALQQLRTQLVAVQRHLPLLGQKAQDGYITNARTLDSEGYGLIVDINGDENTYLALAPASVATGARIGRATFFRQTLARITSLFSIVATKMNLPVTQPLGLMMMGARRRASQVSPSVRAIQVSATTRSKSGLAATPMSRLTDGRGRSRLGLEVIVVMKMSLWRVESERHVQGNSDNSVDRTARKETKW